jgi:hypothetical protein
MKIKSNHPARKAVQSLGDDWSMMTDAISTIGSVLAEHGIELDIPTYADLNDCEGRINLDLRMGQLAHVTCPNCEHPVDDAGYDNWLVFTWYYKGDTPSGGLGRYECVFYIS